MSETKEMPNGEQAEALDMESYVIPGLDKNATNAVFNCLNYLCHYIRDFFEAQGDGKDFVYNHAFEDIDEVLTVTVKRQKINKATGTIEK